jgi:hypothetical protein
MIGTALFSDCERYRYELTRTWDVSLPWCCFIGLNPSTADASINDPTIRRCIAFAQAWGYGNLLMLNLYAYRTPSPKVMFATREKYVDILGGSQNFFPAMRQRILERNIKLTVAAWGRHAEDRGFAAIRELPNLNYLALNGDGSPKHPLYLKGTLTPVPFADEHQRQACAAWH